MLQNGDAIKLSACRRLSLFIQVDTWVWEYREGADETDSQGLHTKTVGLHFQIQNSHFTSSGGSLVSRMEIRCTATVGDNTRHKAVFPSLARSLTSNKLAQERFRNSAGNICATELTPALIRINEIQVLRKIFDMKDSLQH
jgi:hypothetical protein